MSERYTSIRLPDVFGSGLAEYGRKTAPEMLEMLRRYAMSQKAVCDAILSSPDQAFQIETYVGVYKRTQIEVIQESQS